MQQEQQGNGLIGGGIGLALGLPVAWMANSALPNYFANEAKATKDYWADREAFERTGKEMSQSMKDIHDENYKQAKNRDKRTTQALSLLTLLGIPITTALLGSTLTD